MKPIYAAGPSITDVERDIVLDAVTNGWYGDQAYHYVEKFQTEFAAYHGRKYGLMTPNCTTAIHLLLAGMGVGHDDEVIAPDLTWIGSTAGISWLGAQTVLADVEYESWCVSRKTIRPLITPRTKAIIAVDLYGNMPEWGPLLKLSDDYGIPIIEDAAEALGSLHQGKKAGSFGKASVFSFHRTKTLTTGEGGMLLLDDDNLYERCAFLRDHGRAKGKTYFNLEVAYKYMPCNLQAALGYAQFTRLGELIDIKRKHYLTYKNALEMEFGSADKYCITNPEREGDFNAAWITGLLAPHHKLSAAIPKFLEAGIPVRPFFYPLSTLPAYKSFNKYRNRTALELHQHGVNLPGAMNLTAKQLQYIVDKTVEIIEAL